MNKKFLFLPTVILGAAKINAIGLTQVVSNK
jgi:hypothetical protein